MHSHELSDEYEITPDLNSASTILDSYDFNEEKRLISIFGNLFIEDISYLISTEEEYIEKLLALYNRLNTENKKTFLIGIFTKNISLLEKLIKKDSVHKEFMVTTQKLFSDSPLRRTYLPLKKLFLS